jgi:hypothetical protein
VKISLASLRCFIPFKFKFCTQHSFDKFNFLTTLFLANPGTRTCHASRWPSTASHYSIPGECCILTKYVAFFNICVVLLLDVSLTRFGECAVIPLGDVGGTCQWPLVNIMICADPIRSAL